MPTYNGTNGPDLLIDPIRSSGFGLFSIVTINGFGGDDFISGQDVFTVYQLFGGSGNDLILGGFNGDVIIGDDFNGGVPGNDTLYGNNGDDLIGGLGGNDTLVGGLGKDTLYGGDGNYGNDGNDVFQYDSVSDSLPGLSRDIIKDFRGNGNLPGDRIDLSRIDANFTITGNQAFTYIGTRAFTGAGQVRYSGGILQGNTDSNLAANFEIQLEGSPLLVASDIIA